MPYVPNTSKFVTEAQNSSPRPGYHKMATFSPATNAMPISFARLQLLRTGRLDRFFQANKRRSDMKH